MTDQGFEAIQFEKVGRVAKLTINRPKVLNALNLQVLRELQQIVSEKKYLDGIQALVITGAGEKAFVAGADISEMQGLSPDQALNFVRLGQSVTEALEALPLVTIAKVQGFAFGGGCELAMACDILLASENALFAQPEVDLGLIAGFGGTQRLAKRVGLPMAMEILCAGRRLSGREALQYGLASTCVAQTELEEALQQMLSRILRAAPLATAETKALVRSSLEIPIKHGLAAEATAFAARFSGHEAKEGLSAFLEKRKAQFTS